MSKLKIVKHFNNEANIVLFHGSCLKLLGEIPSNKIKLIVTSPPYNVGKEYEKKTSLDRYLELQKEVIKQCTRVLSPKGSICWQVGNYVDRGRIIPLDTLLYPIFTSHGLKLRNRLIWHFGHGLHCSNRFSGRYETIIWFTKTDDYTFNLDAVRVPQKYPNKKYFKGPKAGQFSCNPLGKNPGDVWNIPNVKCNHPEKTIHPCQFPVELIERLILAMTNKNDWVFDPFMGVGTTAVASILHGRKAAGSEVVEKYINVGLERIKLAACGRLPLRPMDRPIYDPSKPYNNRQEKIVKEQKTLFDVIVSAQ